MSKTSQTNKAKEAKQKESVEVQDKELEQKATEIVEEEKTASTDEVIKKTKAAKIRGKKYQASKKMVDVNKYYPLKEAISLVKKTSFSKFDGKVEAHVTIFDVGNVGEITFPHLETASKKVVILNDTILAEIKDGKVNFDIIIATPSTMPKLLPFARVLGPKGLMPNPKNGTLTDKPEEAVKKLSVAKTIVKTEKKSPVIHIIVGKVSQVEKELEANVSELIKVINPNKIKKLALCATMGPCVKVEVK
jgi:large subunit ribosomal protein L1